MTLTTEQRHDLTRDIHTLIKYAEASPPEAMLIYVNLVSANFTAHLASLSEDKRQAWLDKALEMLQSQVRERTESAVEHMKGAKH